MYPLEDLMAYLKKHHREDYDAIVTESTKDGMTYLCKKFKVGWLPDPNPKKDITNEQFAEILQKVRECDNS